jgi:hypothetical protein
MGQGSKGVYTLLKLDSLPHKFLKNRGRGWEKKRGRVIKIPAKLFQEFLRVERGVEKCKK